MHSEILLVTAKSFWKVKIISKYYVRSTPTTNKQKVVFLEQSLRKMY